MQHLTFNALIKRSDPVECRRAILSIREEIFACENKVGFGSYIARLYSQISEIEKAIARRLEQQLCRLAELIEEGCERPSIATAQRVTKHEKFVAGALTDMGCTLYRNGWPDFLVTRGKKMFAIEVKQPNEHLRKEQRTMRFFLQKAGISVHVVRDIPDIWKLVDTGAI